jgi:hypothetical protein
MKNKIAKILPKHRLVQSNSRNIYVVDYKNLNKGKVCLLETEPSDIKTVYLKNENEVAVLFDGFEENALPISKGTYNRQCECVVFPAVCNNDDWVLFIETKYSDNLENAFREENDYPYCMVKQIVETVKFFRSKGILESGRRTTAIVSFPNLIEEFNSTFFPVRIDDSEVSAEDILAEHNILIRATNTVQIKSPKRLKF